MVNMEVFVGDHRESMGVLVSQFVEIDFQDHQGAVAPPLIVSASNVLARLNGMAVEGRGWFRRGPGNDIDVIEAEQRGEVVHDSSIVRFPFLGYVLKILRGTVRRAGTRKWGRRRGCIIRFV